MRLDASMGAPVVPLGTTWHRALAEKLCAFFTRIDRA